MSRITKTMTRCVNDEFTNPLSGRSSGIILRSRSVVVIMRAFLLLPLVLGTVMGCADQNSAPQFRSYQLHVFHPSPHSTFIGVAPRGQGEALPRLEELNSRDFNKYLRDLIGCTVQADAESFPIGNERDPSGYMVPISCMSG